MNLWLLALGLMFLAVILYRLDHYVEWRRSKPGRHSPNGIVPSRDDEEPVTEVLPIIRDYEPFDPSIRRLSRAVQRWQEFTSY